VAIAVGAKGQITVAGRARAVDPGTPASVKVRAAEAIFNHAAKAIEIEDSTGIARFAHGTVNGAIGMVQG
jgi:hypothetical protein